MGKTPGVPAQIGTYFSYPQGTTLSGAGDYWLARGGTKVRMTPACRTALLATFEAALERAVSPANVGTSVQNLNELLSADFGGVQRDMTLVALDDWAQGSYRADFKNKFLRGCPKEDWDLLTEIVFRLWNTTGKPIQWNGSDFSFMGWQTSMLDIDTGGWVQMEQFTEVQVPWCWDVSETACDEGWSMYQDQEYAPWGEYKGPQTPNGRMTNWAVNAYEQMGGRANAGSGSYIYLIGQDGLYNGGAQRLGELADGKLGNWTDGLSATSVRRSSTGWSVYQSMLANMKYSHIVFGHETEYRATHYTRTIQRVFYFDPTDAMFYLVDYDDWVTSEHWSSYNELYSGSYIDCLGSGVAVGLTFGIFKGESEQNHVLDYYPPGGTVDIDAWGYITDYRDQMGGMNSVWMDRYMTDTVVSSDSTVKHPYPAEAFAQMWEPGGVNFIDCKMEGNPMSPGQLSAYAGWNEGGAQSGVLLSAAVRQHATRLLGEVTRPRAWGEPGPAPSMYAASIRWWNQWKLVYPEEPNWPPYEAQQGTATQYFPSELQNPQGERRPWVEDGDRWTCEHGGIFGQFEMAFPDYPFGWTSEDMHTILQWNQAAASYDWTFKAMPTA